MKRELLTVLLMVVVFLELISIPQGEKTVTLGASTITPIDAELVNADTLTVQELQSIRELRYYASMYRFLNQDIAREENWKCHHWARNFADQARADGLEIGLAMPLVWVDGEIAIAHLTCFGIVGDRVYCVEPQHGVVCNWDSWTIIID